MRMLQLAATAAVAGAMGVAFTTIGATSATHAHQAPRPATLPVTLTDATTTVVATCPDTFIGQLTCAAKAALLNIENAATVAIEVMGESSYEVIVKS